MSAATGLREMKKERTRAEIVRVALRMFTRRGFDAVTVDEIAAEAEVSHRTFYRYFATKEELVLGPLPHNLEAFQASFGERPNTESVVESVRAAMLAMACTWEEDLDDGRGLLQLIRKTPSLQQRQNERHTAFENVMVPLISSRLGVDPLEDIRPALIAGCAMAAMRTATNQWLSSDHPRPLSPIVENALTMITEAFADVR